MHVLICGASGNIGRLTVAKALKIGHEVTAFARSVHKLEDQDHLYKVQGDVMDANRVNAVMPEQDAVMVVFGAPLNWSTFTQIPDLCTVGTTNIINAMKQHQVKRLICMTGIGAGDSKGHGRWMFDNLILPIILKHIYIDKNRQEQIVMQSNLDWTIVRPAELTDEPESGDYRVLIDLKGKKAKTISRADVADFLVQQIDSNCYGRANPKDSDSSRQHYLHQTPLITS